MSDQTTITPSPCPEHLATITCDTCHATKPLRLFRKQRHSLGSRRSSCSDCIAMRLRTPDQIPDGVTLRDVPDYPGYKVGDDGSVWTTIKSSKLNPSGVLKRLKATKRSCDSYYIVGLYNTDRMRIIMVHRLVLEVFIGPCPPGMEACHKDDNRANNHLDNLRWDTRKGNREDMIRNGRSTRGERNARAILTADDVREIRRLATLRPRLTHQQIATQFKVSRPTISLVLGGKVWGWLE